LHLAQTGKKHEQAKPLKGFGGASVLAAKIGEIIKHRHFTKVQASEILGMPQPKLSGMLRGQFRGISEVKMLECLNRLGRDVEIVVR
jgi:predicted XRE-type DNA-binding protein